MVLKQIGPRPDHSSVNPRPPMTPHAPRGVVPSEPAPAAPPMRSEVTGEIWYPAPPPPAPDRGGPASPAPVGRSTGERIRPWWGLGDALAAVPVIVLASSLLAIASLIIGVAVGAFDLDTVLDEETVAIPAGVIAAGLVGQQLAQGLWPWLVSRRKGRGMASDWGWAIRPIDFAIGPAAAFVALVLAAVVGTTIAQLVGVEQGVDNTQFVRDADGTIAYWVLIASVLIGAPLSEELLFRGLILRAFEKRGGPVLAVVGSTLAFTVPHYIAADPAELAVLLGAIGSVGLVLGVVAVRTRRLGPTIIAHVLFNAVAVTPLVFG